jgi:hypothetical protein
MANEWEWADLQPYWPDSVVLSNSKAVLQQSLNSTGYLPFSPSKAKLIFKKAGD